MQDETNAVLLAPERFREYLLFLARTQLREWGAGKLEASDVVQNTLLEAHRKISQFRGTSEGEMAAWLRNMLAFSLKDARRAQGRAKRDIARERSLEDALDNSSVRLAGCLAVDQSTPSVAAMRHERAVQLATALAMLPMAQREAVVLRHFENRSLEEISRQLDRTPAAVAGLLKRGTQQLRTLLEGSN